MEYDTKDMLNWLAANISYYRQGKCPRPHLDFLVTHAANLLERDGNVQTANDIRGAWLIENTRNLRELVDTARGI